MDVSALSVAALVLVVGCASSVDVPASLWQPGREVVYRYDAAVETWMLLPHESVVQWHLRAKVTVQGGANKATLQLSDLEVGVHNGGKEEGVPSDMLWGPVPEEARHLLNPFSIQYWVDEPGNIGELLVKAGEDSWVVNMKRGLANLLQLNLNNIKQQQSFSMEDGLHGKCVVQYLLEGHTRVRKYIDHSRCESFSSKLRGSNEPLLCHKQSASQERMSDSVVMYELADDPYIKHIEARGGISLQMNRGAIEHHRIVTSQNLTLMEVQEVTQPLVVKDGGERVLLQYELPDKDITQGRAMPSPEQLLSFGQKLLLQLSGTLEQGHLEERPEMLHEEQVARLLYIMAMMDEPTLRKLYIALEGSQGHHFVLVRKLFMELLPRIGSHDAALLLRDLVLARSVKVATAVKLMYAMPLYIRDPTPDLVREFEGLLDDTELNLAVRNTVVLSFGTLVGKMCKDGCSVDTIQNYINKYMDKVTGGEDYGEQMLYLQGLGNMGHYKVLQRLKPIISDPGQSHYVRHHAMWATKSDVRNHPLEIYELYMPILRNHSEILELRVAALNLLTMSMPTVGRLSDIMWLMEDEQDPQFENYWYTFLKSVAHSRNPCYSELAEAAGRILPSVEEPKVDWFASGHYLLDYTNQEYDFGAAIHMSMVTNPRTGVPNLFYLKYWSYMDTIKSTDIALALRLEGISDTISDRLLGMQKLPDNVAKLKEILKDFDFHKLPRDQLHLEFSIIVNGKVIQTYYITRNNANQVLQEVVQPLVENQGSPGSMDMHFINVDLPLDIGEILVTDVGTLAVKGAVLSDVTVYDYHYNMSNQPTELNCIMDMRYTLQGQASIISYNPILNLWNIAKKSRAIHIKFPIEYFWSASNGTATWTFEQTPGKEAGLVWHVQFLTLVQGPEAEEKLNTYCPSCSTRVVAHGSDKLPQEQLVAWMGKENVGGIKVALPECELGGKARETMYNALFDDEETHMNSESMPSGELLLYIMHVQDMLLIAPADGSCGVSVKLFPPAQPAQVEVKMNLVAERKRKDIHSSLDEISIVTVQVGPKQPGGEEVSPWIEVDAKYENEMSKQRVTVDIKLAENNKVCMIATAIRPESSVRPVLFSPASNEVKFLLGFKWGIIEECSQGSDDADVLELAVLPGHSEKQLALLRDHNEGPYEQCWKEIGGKPSRDVPHTTACTQVYKEQNTLRHFQVLVSHKNFPLVPYLQTPWLLYEIGESEPRNLSTLGETELNLEFPADGDAVLKTSDYEVTLDENTQEILETLLLDNQDTWDSGDGVGHMGYVGSCVINVNGVLTFDSANHTDQQSECYTLAVAECIKDEDSPFAVFVKKLEDKLAMKVYLSNDEIEILPGTVLLNGATINTPYSGLLQITMTEDEVHITTSQYIHLVLSYMGKSVEVSMSGMYRGALCGLCGDFNSNPHNDNAHQYKLECA